MTKTLSTSRTLALASLGGALEFYDFVVFVFFVAVLGKVFFPAGLAEWLRQLQAFGIFAAGYLARPLGGIVMAHFGDRYGRKRIFTFSVLLMAFSTLMIGLLPTYGTIGAAAPLALLLLRMLQGAAIGGEAPGGWVFVAEHAPPERTGLALGLLTSGLTLGILLGSLIATLSTAWFTPAQMAAGWWRLPFLLGGVFGLFAVVLRRWLEETPVFQQMRQRAAASRALPIGMVLQQHRGAVAASMGVSWMLTATIVVLILMTPALLQKLFLLKAAAVQPANLGATALLCLSVIGIGMAADKFGTRRAALVSLPLSVAGAYALYAGVASKPELLLPLYLLVGLTAGCTVFTALVMVRAFPPSVRFSGVSFSYNVIYAIFGGITPPLILWLARFSSLAPAHYVAVATLAGLCAILLAPEADAR